MNCDEEKMGLENYLEFINNMPLNKEQKISFTEKYIKILKKCKRDDEKTRIHYEEQVLKDITNIS